MNNIEVLLISLHRSFSLPSVPRDNYYQEFGRCPSRLHFYTFPTHTCNKKIQLYFVYFEFYIMLS